MAGSGTDGWADQAAVAGKSQHAKHISSCTNEAVNAAETYRGVAVRRPPALMLDGCMPEVAQAITFDNAFANPLRECGRVYYAL